MYMDTHIHRHKYMDTHTRTHILVSHIFHYHLCQSKINAMNCYIDKSVRTILQAINCQLLLSLDTCCCTYIYQSTNSSWVYYMSLVWYVDVSEMEGHNVVSTNYVCQIFEQLRNCICTVYSMMISSWSTGYPDPSEPFKEYLTTHGL